jgi:enamine deaminase RidA (YjgF/YER057c/UK114 family)
VKRLLAALFFAAGLAAASSGEAPAVTVAATRHLVFFVSRPDPQGDLLRQLNQALHDLLRQARGARIVKLRAFITETAKNGGVEAAAKDLFRKRKLPVPVMSVILVAALPDGAKVAIEAAAAAPAVVNPEGLAFISGQPASTEKPQPQMLPLIQKSFADLQTAYRAVGLQSAAIVRLTCFMTSLAGVAAVQRLAASEFPQASANFVQFRVDPARGAVECEAAARLRSPVGAPLKFVNPEGLPKSPQYSHVALVGAPQVAFTSAQVAAGLRDADARAAFEHLQKALEHAGASINNVAMSSLYPVSPAASDLARKIRFDFYDKRRPPASTLLQFQGLPFPGASFAVDVIAPVGK